MKKWVCLLALIALGLVLASCDNPGGPDLNPGTGNPGIDNPGTDNPGTGDPGTGNPDTGDPLTTNYTVTFNANGGDGAPPPAQTVQAGYSITLPGGSGLTKTGYVFHYWNTKPDGTGENYGAGDTYTPTASITLYVKWLDETVPIYTLTFDANGGTGTPPRERIAEHGGNIPIPDGSGLTKTGYAFSGWNTKPDGTGNNYRSGDHFWPITDTTLYAQWDEFRTLTQKLAWLQNNAQSGGSYILEVEADESIEPHTLNTVSYDYKTGITITLIGVDSNRTISLSSNDSMFTVGPGVTLVLDNNITLQGHSDNNYSLVSVIEGALVMNTGAKITGNTNNNTFHVGGVFVYDGTFTMNGGEIYGNTGHGVFVYDGTFTMNDGEISGNTGSGVQVSPPPDSDPNLITFTMNGGEISGNTGGGVYVGRATFTMTNGSISESIGRGVTVIEGTFTMSGGEIYGNTGGGVSVSDGTFTMSDGEIYGNTGGGVDVSRYSSFETTFTMSGTAKIYNNTGGGVDVGYYTNFTMSGGEIYGNTVSGTTSYIGGGGVRNSGTFTMNGGEISGNTVSGTSSNYGGGVYAGGTFTMNGGEISDNTGGGVYVSYNANFTMSGTAKIYGHTVSRTGGGGVYVEGSPSYETNFTMSGGEIYNNTVTSTDYYDKGGGGVYVRSNANFTMSGAAKIYNNTVSGTGLLYGGGVYVDTNATFTMSSSTSGTATISGNTVSGTLSVGGGVCVGDPSNSGGATFAMEYGMISGNTVIGNADSRGGGVYITFNTIFYGGETIIGYKSDPNNGNVVKIDDGSGTITIAKNGGHAVYAGDPWGSPNRNYRRKESTSTSGRSSTGAATNNNGIRLNGDLAWGKGGGWGEADLAERLYALQDTAENLKSYTLEVETHEGIELRGELSHLLNFNKTVTIILKGIDNPSVGLKDIYESDPKGSLFTIENGVKLELYDVNLVGKSNNTAPLIHVMSGGSFIMHSGNINSNTNNTVNSTNPYIGGGGVYVASNGLFTMNGGEILINYVRGGSGGGVCVIGGTFTMNGGKIYHNYAYLPSNPTNTDGGGGVAIIGGTFTKTGGTIGGEYSNPYNQYDNPNFVYIGNSIQNGRGNEVWACTSSGTTIKRRETNAGPEVNLSFNGTGTTGVFTGGWEY